MMFRAQLWVFIAWLLLSGTLAACGDSMVLNPLADSDVLFVDQFAPGQMGQWLLEGDAEGQTAVINERLVIQIDAPNTVQYATLAQQTFKDFVLEADVQQLAGDERSSYGLIFRRQGPDAFYRFEVIGTGLYVLERRDPDGTWTRLLEEWQESEAIKPGVNVTNRLKVVANGPTLAVYANDQFLTQVTDFEYAAGGIALDAGTFGNTGLQVAFDNVVVKRP